MANVTRLGIDPAKIVAYLLDTGHPEGRSKAKFFLARGFDRTRPQEMADRLVHQATSGWPGKITGKPGATRFMIIGPIRCPDGSTPDILSIWQAEIGGDTAMFVTAYPYRRKPPRP